MTGRCPWPPELSQRGRLWLAAIAQIAFPVALAAALRSFGADILPLGVVPVGLAAWALGGRVGIASAIAQIAGRSLIVGAVGAAASDVAAMPDGPTVLLLLVTAPSIGLLRELRVDLVRRAREAEAIARATGHLVAGAAAHETLQGILTAAMSVVPSSVASFIVPGDSGALRVAAILGGPPEWVGRTYLADTGVSGRAWRSGTVVRVDDVTQDPDYVPWSPETRSALAVPVARDGEQRGLIYFEDAHSERFVERDVRLMRAFADHAWIALESAEQRHELEAAGDRFAAAFNAVPSSLIITRAEDSTIIDANDTFLELIGRSRAEVVGRTGLELGLVDEATHARVDARFRSEGRLFNEPVATDRLGHGLQHFLVSSDVATIGGRPQVVTVATDVTERRRDALAIERLALVDELTGLPNRNQFMRRLEGALATAGERTIAVLLLDIDDFKDINDTFGHRAGDELLRKVGARLRADLGADGVVARLGGDEFALLVESDAATALRIAETARRSLEIPFELAGHGIALTGSIGVSFFPEHGRNDTTLLRRADIAMYAAKATGAGTTVYAAALDAHSPTRAAMAADLRRAIADARLAVHYQPIVPLRDGGCFGVEALVRWSHHARGPVSPAEFVPIAERSGLIKPMTEFVLRRSVASASAWTAAGRPVQISVNVSMRNLRDPQFVDMVARRIDEHRLAPERLCLEITEGVAMADPDHSLAVLMRLREAGVRVAIDDFGTGYSSLGYLRRLPVDALKIDRIFVAGLTRDSASESIVRATIELGHSLGLIVVAEGVEDDAQLACLRDLGCDRAQGYRIARPMPAEDVAGWLARESGRYAA